MPAFIVGELDAGRYAVVVPSVPTPLAGAVYVRTRERVHPIDLPLSNACSRFRAGFRAPRSW